MIPIDEDTVREIRERLDDARAVAAARFRDDFNRHGGVEPNERWRFHLEIQAQALLERARWVSLESGSVVRYRFVDDRTIQPYVAPIGRPALAGEIRPERDFYPAFRIERSPEALLEYWIVVSELSGSPSWNLTRLITNRQGYGDALAKMRSPDIVRALVVSWLPSAEWREDGTALLEVVVYSRSGDERIEKRQLLLDLDQEFRFHGRDLIAEGRGGVAV